PRLPRERRPRHRARWRTGFARTVQFVYQDFLPGRAPAWPDELPGKAVWSATTGLLFIVTAGAIARRRAPRWLGLTAIAPIGLWALARLVPVVLADTWLGGSWTHAGKAVVFISGLVALHGSVVGDHVRADRLGCLGLGAFLILTGLQHFR